MATRTPRRPEFRGYRPRTSPRNHPVAHQLAAPRDENGTPIRESIRAVRYATAALGAFHALRARRGSAAARAARSERVERRRQRIAARTGRR